MSKQKKQPANVTKEENEISIEDREELIRDFCKKLFSLIGVKVEIKIDNDKENEAIKVSVKSEEETGLLIGNRGETLDAIQSITGISFRQKTGIWQRVIVNVSDWRERQELKLKDLAEKTAQRAKESNEDQVLYNLSPAERRIIHLYLSSDNEIQTESDGEGRNRYLVVRVKK